MMKTVQMKELYVAEVAGHFRNAWVFSDDPSEELIAENSACFTSKFSSDACKIMSIEDNFTMTYHLQ